ncbi:MAG TPA: hypothetical protein VMW44_00270 [Candidatus Bathyarchaeia archaeon]|nr:hypothetical protein [Candidatus Bathyarchaeia archaeon]
MTIGPGGGTTGTDSNAVHVNEAGEIAGVAIKNTPIAADYILIEDSEDSNNKKSVLVGSISHAGFIDGEVDVYANLPAAADHSGEFWLVTTASGVWLITRKPAGLYYSDGASWEAAPDIVPFFSDANFEIYDDADDTKKINFDASQITTGNARTYTAPDIDGIIQLEWSETNTYYVGKHGNDSDDGLSIAKAKLTFGDAISTASAGDLIICLDAGTYTENLTGASNIIHAPNATIAGVHTLIDGDDWKFATATIAAGVIGFSINVASAECHLEIKSVEISGNGIGFVNLQGKMFCHLQHIEMGAGFAVGSTTADELYIDFEEIKITGAGTAFACTASGDINAIGQCVEDDGSGTLFFAANVACNMAATISKVDIEVLSNIGAAASAFLNVARLTGTNTESGASSVQIGGSTKIAITGTSSLDNQVTINESGADVDFRVEGVGQANALFVQGSDGFVGIGITPTQKLQVAGNIMLPANSALYLDTTTNYGLTSDGSVINFRAGGATRVTLVGATANFKLAGTAVRGTTEGTNHLDIFNGTAPAGTLANGISLYSTAGELRVMDAAGNATLLSPHDKRTNEWVYDSVDIKGKRLRIDIEKMLRFLNDKFGTDFVKEFQEAA